VDLEREEKVEKKRDAPTPFLGSEGGVVKTDAKRKDVKASSLRKGTRSGKKQQKVNQTITEPGGDELVQRLK